MFLINSNQQLHSIECIQNRCAWHNGISWAESWARVLEQWIELRSFWMLNVFVHVFSKYSSISIEIFAKTSQKYGFGAQQQEEELQKSISVLLSCCTVCSLMPRAICSYLISMRIRHRRYGADFAVPHSPNYCRFVLSDSFYGFMLSFIFICLC